MRAALLPALVLIASPVAAQDRVEYLGPPVIIPAARDTDRPEAMVVNTPSAEARCDGVAVQPIQAEEFLSLIHI